MVTQLAFKSLTTRHALLETLTLYIPYGDYSELYPLGEVDKLKNAGYSPYALEAVTYGTQIDQECNERTPDLYKSIGKYI